MAKTCPICKAKLVRGKCPSCGGKIGAGRVLGSPLDIVKPIGYPAQTEPSRFAVYTSDGKPVENPESFFSED